MARRRQSRGAQAIDLPLLEREKSLELLALQAEAAEANEVCEEVGDLLLALAVEEGSAFGDEQAELSRARSPQDTGRLKEAEPLMGRAFGIVLRSLGLDHPNTQNEKANYIDLPQAMGLSEPEIQAKLQSMRPPEAQGASDQGS